MNPVRMEQVRDIAFSGEVLPQKSTDFFPKLLSGLTIYSLEDARARRLQEATRLSVFASEGGPPSQRL